MSEPITFTRVCTEVMDIGETEQAVHMSELQRQHGRSKNTKSGAVQ